MRRLPEDQTGLLPILDNLEAYVAKVEALMTVKGE